MKERDYIGLGSDSSSSSSVTSAVTTVDGDYGDTELRLGIGPPAGGGSGSSNGGDAAAAKVESNLALNQHESASPAAVISPRKHGLNAGQEHTTAAGASSVLPPATVSVVPSEVIIKPLAHHHGQDQKSFGGNADHKSSYGGGYNQMVAVARQLPPPPPQAVLWHPTSSSNNQLQPRVNGVDFAWTGYAIPVPKVASVPAKRPYPVDWPNTAVPMPIPGQAAWPLNNPAADKSSGATSPPAPSNIDNPAEPKARVVGWPPVRSFRKNTLAANSQSHPHLKKADHHRLDIHGGGAAVEEENIAGSLIDPSKSALYVKAKVDGVKIGRKVDLKAYDSYGSLKLALQQMFQGYVNCHGEVVKLDLVHGNEYVLTHEDKDGDWMLVGDVPWEMFTATVKSLRILKSSDARGLGGRASVAGKA